MVVSHAFPGTFQPRGRRGNKNALALGVSIGAHILAVYAVVQFGYVAMAPPPATTEKEVIVETSFFRLPKIIPEPAKPVEQRPTIAIRQPAQTPYEPPVTFDAIPDSQPRASDPGPLVLPTAPPSLPGDGVGMGAGGGAQTTAPPPRPPMVIRSPSWIRQPTASQLQAAYPNRAAEAGIGGAATLNCAVLPSGAVNDCRVTAQSPPGEGFGPAAIQLSRFFLMSPPLEDGVPITNARVVIPVNFRVPG